MALVTVTLMGRGFRVLVIAEEDSGAHRDVHTATSYSRDVFVLLFGTGCFYRAESFPPLGVAWHRGYSPSDPRGCTAGFRLLPSADRKRYRGTCLQVPWCGCVSLGIARGSPETGQAPSRPPVLGPSCKYMFDPLFGRPPSVEPMSAGCGAVSAVSASLSAAPEPRRRSTIIRTLDMKCSPATFAVTCHCTDCGAFEPCRIYRTAPPLLPPPIPLLISPFSSHPPLLLSASLCIPRSSPGIGPPALASIRSTPCPLFRGSFSSARLRVVHDVPRHR